MKRTQDANFLSTDGHHPDSLQEWGSAQFASIYNVEEEFGSYD
ncbi:MAG TPA: hypothetical protein VF614_00140 [Chthoniobacteraceae bacterium]